MSELTAELTHAAPRRGILHGTGGDRRFLVTLACEGGLPLRLLQHEGAKLRSFFLSLLEDYYRRAYEAIRRHCAAERVAVVFHDGFRPHGEFVPFFRDTPLRNVLFDVHRYQCFAREDLDLDIHGHLHKAGVLWREEAQAVQGELGVPAIAGEWSLGLDLKVVSLWADGPYDDALQGLDPFQEDVALRAYAAAQLLAFERYRGWFFWSYRTETTPAWCFRECVARGWLPRRFA